jgi:predicted Zn finger-like uncharacterized protein
MSDSFVTQCPHCRTSFRVSQVQLSAAQGAVRCGACLHVFNAHKHLLEQSPAIAKPATAIPSDNLVKPKEPAPSPPKVESVSLARKDSLDTVRIHDDLDLDSLDLDEELARLEQEEQLLTRNLQLLEPAPTQQPEDSKTTASKTRADERWAEQLLDEAQSPAPSAPDLPATEPATASADDEQEPLDDSPELPDPYFSGEEEDAQAADEDHSFDAQNQESKPTKDTDVPHTEARFSPGSNLFDLNQDPLQLQWQAPSKPWGRWLGWSLLNLIAAGALLTQYSIYHFNELARQDQYRPWFESICPQLGCTLPPKVDVDLIKSSNLVIRSHPDFAGALVVDAILYNRASFAQPFPLLELRFADINNKPMANRRFKPSEYLAGELAGQSEMPPQTPIHISLDILDPGQEAVNYNLTFQSPE